MAHVVMAYMVMPYTGTDVAYLFIAYKGVLHILRAYIVWPM